MKVIFGGTFDPVHIGHLRMATELVTGLGVESVDLMPCFQAVHKDSVSASVRNRLDMLNLATSNDDCLLVDDREIQRRKPSYTVDSLREIRQEIAGQPLCIVMGTDSALGLTSWRSVDDFSCLAHIVVVKRPGENENALKDVEKKLQCIGFELVSCAQKLHKASSGLALIIELTQLDISSTAIRKYVSENKSIRYLVVDAVNEYICDNGLYKE